MFKKLSILVLSLFIAAQSLTASAIVYSERPFLDVSSGHQFIDAIRYVKNAGIVDGYDDGTYKADNQINRAEFVKIIIGSVFDEDTINSCNITKRYPDVKVTEWYYPYLCVATKNGIISGYPDGSFKPVNNINIVEAAKIIVTAFEYELTTGGEWYTPFIRVLETKKAIPLTIESLTQYITRGDMAEIIYRLKEKITDKESAYIL